MYRQEIETNKLPCVVVMQIVNFANNPFQIRIRSNELGCILYERTISDSPANDEYRIPLPLVTPTVVCEVDGEVSISHFAVEVLPVDMSMMEQELVDYVLFASQISLLLEQMPRGHYLSDCERFLVLLDNYVKVPETNRIIGTPASVNRVWKKFYLSRDFMLPMTVPMRMFILLHEYFHAYMEHSTDPDLQHFSTDELECDRRAAHAFFLLGFPFSECAKTLIMMYQTYGTPEQQSRIEQILQIIQTEFIHN